MEILLVYGDPNGGARAAARATARRLRSRGVPARVRAAERIRCRPVGAWTVLLVDRRGAAAIRGLRDRLGVHCGAPALAAVRCGDAPPDAAELERRWRWRVSLLTGPTAPEA